MAAADYYKASSSMLTDEEELEIQARDINQKTLLFQARLRGFLARHRVFQPDQDDVAVENNGHLAYINERSNTNKTINQNTEVDELGDNYMQRDSIYVHDLWHTTTPGKAHSTDLQRRLHGPINSAANYNKKELNKVQSRSRFSTDETAIIENPTSVSGEATLESAAKFRGEVAPWWIESQSDSKEGGLCNICRRISFDTLLHKVDALIVRSRA